MIPVPGFKITTRYRERGKAWASGFHTGVDYAAPTGTVVVAARPGRVVWCNHGSAFGRHQLEITAGGSRDFYAHMPYRIVDHGDFVLAGQPIGYVGDEGNATGPHLHFERHSVGSGPWSASICRWPQWSIRARFHRALTWQGPLPRPGVPTW